MNNKGFTLFEMLIWFLVIGIFVIIALSLGRNTFATSLTTVGNMNDDEIFLAAERYVTDGNGSFYNNKYICVSTDTLREEGYLNSSFGKTRLIKMRVSRVTRVVEKSYYVDSCN